LMLAWVFACAPVPRWRELTPDEQGKFERLAALPFQRRLLAELALKEREQCGHSVRLASADAPPLDYDRFCDSKGDLKGDEEVLRVLHEPDALERVYEDAQRGDPRAGRAFWRLEGLYWWIGRTVAEQMASLYCQTVPVCRIDWSVFDYLSKTRAIFSRTLMRREQRWTLLRARMWLACGPAATRQRYMSRMGPLEFSAIPAS
jgi:hypothetical protein